MKKFLAGFSLVVLLLALVAGVAHAQEEPGPPPPQDSSWLEMLLTWLVSGGGAACLAYKLMEEVRWLRDLTPKEKRFTSLVLSGVLAVAGYLSIVVMLYESPPDTWRAWIEQLVYIAGLGAVGGQIVHGWKRL